MSKLTKWFEENKIDEVEAMIPDIAGTARGKFVPIESYSEEDGIRLPEGMFSQSVTGDYIWENSPTAETDPDMHLLPDIKTARLVPWALEPTAQIIHDCRYANGKVVDIAPRYILKKVLNLFKRKGWEPVVAPEIEFYLVKINTDPDYPLEPPVGRSGRQETSRQTFSVDAVNEFENIIEDIYNFSEVQGLHIDTLTHEDGIAQLEVNFRHGNALDLADQVFLFKRTAREAAFKNKILRLTDIQAIQKALKTCFLARLKVKRNT